MLFLLANRICRFGSDASDAILLIRLPLLLMLSRRSLLWLSTGLISSGPVPRIASIWKISRLGMFSSGARLVISLTPTLRSISLAILASGVISEILLLVSTRLVTFGRSSSGVTSVILLPDAWITVALVRYWIPSRLVMPLLLSEFASDTFTIFLRSPYVSVSVSPRLVPVVAARILFSAAFSFSSGKVTS